MDRIKYQMHSFGCKVNTYDSGLMQKKLTHHGYELDEQSSVHILNTCAVTEESTKEAVRLVRKIKAKNPNARIVVTGCSAQVDNDYFEKLPSVDLIVANSHKGQIPFLIEQLLRGQLREKTFRSNIFRKEDLEEGGGIEAHHTRSFLKIQDGCNSFCTFCVIPYARGTSRSLPMMELVRRVNELYQAGVREVVLTGVHIGDYFDESKPGGLEDLVESLLKHTPMPRFRLTSLEPIEMSDRLFDLYTDSRLCRHFHLSIQSASTEVLKDMKRKYTEHDVRSTLDRIARELPGSFVGMDVIAGFPTETDEHFLTTYTVLHNTSWSRLHVFPYSVRSGTKAALMNSVVTPSEKKNRSKRLRELSEERFLFEAKKQLGSQKEILLLKQMSQPMGISRDYWNVRLLNEMPQTIEEVKIKVSQVNLAGELYGELA